MIIITLLAILFTGYAHCQTTSEDRQCNMAMEMFNDSDSGFCKVAYENIVSQRDPTCTESAREILCEGMCLQPARTISCNCHNSTITDNIGRICSCASNISCPFLPDNCSRTVDIFQHNEQCGAAYSSLVASNGTCSSCCQSLCDMECNMLLRNVSCHCSKMMMSEGLQIIINIQTMCKCSTQDCPSGTGCSLLSLWILVIALAVTMVTW